MPFLNASAWPSAAADWPQANSQFLENGTLLIRGTGQTAADRERSCTVKRSWGCPPRGSSKQQEDVTRLLWSTRSYRKRLVIILKNFLYTPCARRSSFAPSPSIHVQARLLCAPTHSSLWSHGSLPPWHPLTWPGTLPQACYPRTCPCSPLSSTPTARSLRPARRLSALAASQTPSAARPASRSPGAAEPSSPNCSSWGWRRSFRSRSISPHQTG